MMSADDQFAAPAPTPAAGGDLVDELAEETSKMVMHARVPAGMRMMRPRRVGHAPSPMRMMRVRPLPMHDMPMREKPMPMAVEPSTENPK